MKIALLIDGKSIARWQAHALERLGPGPCFTVFNCTNARSRNRRFKHAIYYLLNILSLRNPLTRRVVLSPSLAIASSFDFQCDHDGAWQCLPPSLLDRIIAERPSCILKFGMGLLRVPPASELPFPILSYHHGDPREFRGRPAGFYEMLQGRNVIGQVVQLLSNKLDAGPIVAFAETKVHHHSYRQTIVEAFAASPALLPHALRNAIEARTLSIDPVGRNYRLPSNSAVVRFIVRRGLATLKRAAYGLFVEKVWEVAEAPASTGEEIISGPFPDPSSWRTVQRPAGYRFLADPFPHPGGNGLLVEALSSRSGFGEILHIGPSATPILLAGNRHYSYPSTLCVNGQALLIPEICEWSEPQVFQICGSSVRSAGRLDLAGQPRVIDPTLFERNSTTFLFGNTLADGSSVLRLWWANSVFGHFVEHPASPIRMSPAGSRMAGAIMLLGDDIYRLGQDFRGLYGDGILLFRIDDLSPTSYRETWIKDIHFANCHGPHTLNVNGQSLVFDYYYNRFSLCAGIRRIKSKVLSSRRSS